MIEVGIMSDISIMEDMNKTEEDIIIDVMMMEENTEEMTEKNQKQMIKENQEELMEENQEELIEEFEEIVRSLTPRRASSGIDYLNSSRRLDNSARRMEYSARRLEYQQEEITTKVIIMFQEIQIQFRKLRYGDVSDKSKDPPPV